MPRPLPPDFAWHRDDRFGQDWLQCNGDSVGYVAQTIHPGRWLSLVNRHDDFNRWPAAYSSRRETAMRWVERWAAANADRLRHEIATGARSRNPVKASRDDKNAAKKAR